jgi:hypothetical protein
VIHFAITAAYHGNLTRLYGRPANGGDANLRRVRIAEPPLVAQSRPIVYSLLERR